MLGKGEEKGSEYELMGESRVSKWSKVVESVETPR